jgi:histidine triad (HIT) family protein
VTSNDEGCFICLKHQQGHAAEGGIVYQDDLVYVGHIHTMGHQGAYRGYLMVEPKRHVMGLGDLTDDEAGAVGISANRCARLLKEVLGAEHVYAFVYGGAVPHLHVHLAPRYPGTPRDFWGPRLMEWPDAPKVDPPEMRALVSRLRHGID